MTSSRCSRRPLLPPGPRRPLVCDLFSLLYSYVGGISGMAWWLRVLRKAIHGRRVVG